MQPRLSVNIVSFVAGLLLYVAALPSVANEGEAKTESPELNEREVISILDEAGEVFDEKASLPESTIFSRDQEDADEDLQKLMDDAVKILDLPDIQDIRKDYRELEEERVKTQSVLQELRRERIFADEGDRSIIAKYIPTETLKTATASTKSDYDELIKEKEEKIELIDERLQAMRERLSASLNDIGVAMEPDVIEYWLSSAIAEDVMSMSVVFGTIRKVTLKLEELTDESGEDLTYAKRYYGMIVILHKIVKRMQSNFITRIDDEIIPKLKVYRSEANEIIREAKSLLSENKDNFEIVKNIETNEFNKNAIDSYMDAVRDYRNDINDAFEVIQREEEIAINRYRTVKLSSNVYDLISDGMKTFDTISNLQIPTSRTFENKKMRRQFRELTGRIESE